MARTKTIMTVAGMAIAVTIAVFLGLVLESSTDHTQSFEYSVGFSDNFNGTYFEQWCVGNNGIWVKSENFCGFETEADEHLADIALNELLFNHQISQEKTQAICKFLEMECPSHARFTGGLDPPTGELFVVYDYKDTSYKFDVTSDDIKYLIRGDDGKKSDWASISSP